MFRKQRAAPDSLYQVINSTSFNTNSNDRSLLYSLTKDNLGMIGPMKVLGTPLNVHSGCVNAICWNDSGTSILSGFDDQHLKVEDPFGYNEKVLIHFKTITSHCSNIFCARFLPFTNDTCVVSAAGDGSILYTDFNAEKEYNDQNKFIGHEGTCYKVLTIPSEPYTFLSCGENGTVRQFDLRVQQNCAGVTRALGTEGPRRTRDRSSDTDEIGGGVEDLYDDQSWDFVVGRTINTKNTQRTDQRHLIPLEVTVSKQSSCGP